MCSGKTDAITLAEPLLAEVLKYIPYAVAVFDTEMHYIACSRRWLEEFQLTGKKLTGLSHYDVFPEISDEWRQIHRECLAGATRSRDDDPFLRADGSVDYISWQVSPWKHEDGNIGGIIIFSTVSTSSILNRKRTHEYLQEMQVLLNSTRAVPWRLDFNSKKFTYIGHQIEKLMGYSVDTWIDLKSWVEHIYPDDRGTALDFCIKMTSEGRDHDFEYRVLTASGETIWVRDVVTVVKDERGEVEALTGLFIDISEQKRTEAQYRSVIETSGDGFWLVDSQGFLLQTNDAYARLSGYTKEELIGMHITELEAQENPEETARHIEKIVNTGSDLFETQHRRKSGEIWDVEISTSFTSDSGGRFFVFARDITERKRTQQELRLIAEVFNNTSEGIVITDPQGVIIDVNPAYCEITGYQREEMIGENPSKIKSDKHDHEFYTRMWQSLVNEGFWVGEIWDRRKSGEVFPKWLTINAVHDDNDRLTHYVGTFSDISVLKGIEKELEFMAYYDPLTGLPNRILFKDRLEHAISNCRRHENHCAVLFLDLDRFKLINDTLGHSAGDELLIEVARRLKQSVRDNDTIARFGGDEFTLLLTQLRNTDAAAIVAQNINAVLSEPVKLHGENMHIGASIGIAIFPEDGENFTTLTRHADAAMYEAKANGRGQYHFFSDYMDKTAHEHLKIERDLHRAIEEEQFFLVFQPQVDARSGKTIQCEALIRWKHPEHGLISPDNFIPIAEDTGLILPIGDWVISEVCRQLVRWRQLRADLPKVAINLSARQFRNSGLVERIMSILEEYDVGVDAIEFEITESVAMENAESTMQRLSELSQHGFSIAIDDFGTGYSSLSYLKRFPVHKLKLDRSFVMDIQDDANDAAISSAVIHMSQKLGLDVVAEGVELVQQRDFLLGQGCHIMQGYLFSHPLDSDAFIQYLNHD